MEEVLTVKRIVLLMGIEPEANWILPRGNGCLESRAGIVSQGIPVKNRLS